MKEEFNHAHLLWERFLLLSTGINAMLYKGSGKLGLLHRSLFIHYYKSHLFLGECRHPNLEQTQGESRPDFALRKSGGD